MFDSIPLCAGFQNNELVPWHPTKEVHQLCKYCYECVDFNRSCMFWYIADTLFLISSLDMAVPSLAGGSLCILAPVCFEPFVTAQWPLIASLLLVWQYVTCFSWTFPALTWNQLTFPRPPGCFQWEMLIGAWRMGVKELFVSIRVIGSKPFQWTKSENICKRNTSGAHTNISNSSLGLQVFI